MENEFGQVLGTLAVITALAFLVETLVEAVMGRLMDQVPKLTPYRWTLIYFAVAAGIGGAFVYQFDLLYLLAQFVGSPVVHNGFGTAITGISIGMGAGYIHQFISKFFPSKTVSDQQAKAVLDDKQTLKSSQPAGDDHGNYS